MAIIKNLRFFVFLSLLASLVITSHFSVFEMLVECPHHTESSHQHHDDTSDETPCANQHNCISAFQYIVPSLSVESQSQYKTPHKLNFDRIVLAEPFLEAPFQPPRLA